MFCALPGPCSNDAQLREKLPTQEQYVAGEHLRGEDMTNFDQAMGEMVRTMRACGGGCVLRAVHGHGEQ